MRETRVDKSLMNRPFIVEMYLRLSPRAIGVGGSEPDPFLWRAINRRVMLN